MKIISKFKDYYDTAQGLGQDPRLTYQRTPVIHDLERWAWDGAIPEILEFGMYYYGFQPHLGVVGFCGKAFPVWIRRDFDLTAENLGRNVSINTALSSDAVIASVPKDSEYAWLLTKVERAIDRVAKYEGTVLSAELFRHFRCPAFLAYAHGWRGFSTTLIANPRLATLGFMQHYDAFSAFQEIAMYLGSSLATEDTAPRTVGGDDVVTRAHGFTEESFRTKAPGLKKLNRKSNKERKLKSDSESS